MLLLCQGCHPGLHQPVLMMKHVLLPLTAGGDQIYILEDELLAQVSTMGLDEIKEGAGECLNLYVRIYRQRQRQGGAMQTIQSM